MFDQATLDRIRASVDLAEIVGEHVALKKAGANSLKGLCPFHKEKTPSFHVNTAQQFYKCFGCGAAGNVFIFLTKIESIPFPEAVHRLAERARISLPQSNSPEEQERKRLQQVCETAASLYQRALREAPEAARARAYLEKRRIPAGASELFRLGYSTGRELFASRLHPALLSRAGLAGPNRDGGQHDRMRGRIVLPIMDENGRVIGFGGRALDENQQPKYLNTPETPLYTKSKSLYALCFAKDAIRKSGRTILVEGYFDAIQAHAHGMSEAVAVLGTSLTEAQMKLLKRFARTLLIVYDEDVGGNEAAVRGLDLATEAGFEVKIVRLPGENDPDEFLLNRGADAFRQALEDAAGGEAPTDALQERGMAVSLFDFRMEVASRRSDPSALQGKKQIVADLLPYLSRIPSAIERFEYVKRLAERLNLRERDVVEEMEKFAARLPAAPRWQPTGRSQPAGRWQPTGRPGADPAPAPGAWRAERHLLAGALSHKAAAVAALLDLPPEVFRHPQAARLAARLREMLEDGRSFSAASLMDDFQDAPAVLELLASADGDLAVPDGAYREAAEQLLRMHNRHRLQAVQHMIEREKDPAAMTQLLEEKQRIATANT